MPYYRLTEGEAVICIGHGLLHEVITKTKALVKSSQIKWLELFGYFLHLM